MLRGFKREWFKHYEKVLCFNPKLNVILCNHGFIHDLKTLLEKRIVLFFIVYFQIYKISFNSRLSVLMPYVPWH